MFNRQNFNQNCGCERDFERDRRGGCERQRECPTPRRSTCPVVNCQSITCSTTPETQVSSLDLHLISDESCAVPCQFVNFTLTITNNCSSELVNPILNFDLGDSLCFTRGTLAVNGQPKPDVTCPRHLILDNIPANGTITVTLSARVMTNERYIVSYADLSYQICCCCTTRCLRTISNGNILQVCQCCCGCSRPEEIPTDR